MSIMRRKSKNNYKLQKGIFNVSKYEKWILKNEGKSALLLFKLNDEGLRLKDGNTENIYVMEGELYIVDYKEGKGIVRYRINKSCLDWVDI
jgi:hypothetical protein